MTTKRTRVTREEAAELAGVTMRTINRWREQGLITARYAPDWRTPATYSLEEVMRVVRMRDVTLPEAD